jgi:hypothetical protein
MTHEKQRIEQLTREAARERQARLKLVVDVDRERQRRITAERKASALRATVVRLMAQRRKADSEVREAGRNVG